MASELAGIMVNMISFSFLDLKHALSLHKPATVVPNFSNSILTLPEAPWEHLTAPPWPVLHL